MSWTLGGDGEPHNALLEREEAVMHPAIGLWGPFPTGEFGRRHGARAREPPEGVTPEQDPEECDRGVIESTN